MSVFKDFQGLENLEREKIKDFQGLSRTGKSPVVSDSRITQPIFTKFGEKMVN